LNILKESKQPVYIELPKDVASQPIKYDVYTQGTPSNQKSDPLALKESIEDVSSFIKLSKSPVIIMGVQVSRFNLEDSLVKFAEKHNIPIVTTLLSKSSIDEKHPLFSGVYFGEQTLNESVKSLVRSSDCLLIFGEMLTDAYFGFTTPNFNPSSTVFCSIENLRVKNHIYCGVRFIDFCKDFFKSDLGKKSFLPPVKSSKSKFVPEEGCKLNLKRFFDKVDSLLDDRFAVLTDLGDNLFDFAELTVSHHRFVSSAFYCSMGLALPGSIGLQLSMPEVRPLVILGEESFQTSSVEISTILHNKLNPIVFVLNSRSDLIRSWNYNKICDMMGGGSGYVVESERDLEMVVESCLKNKDLSVVSVLLDYDYK
jgi:indolepyruvate decarboxylase